MNTSTKEASEIGRRLRSFANEKKRIAGLRRYLAALTPAQKKARTAAATRGRKRQAIKRRKEAKRIA